MFQFLKKFEGRLSDRPLYAILMIVLTSVLANGLIIPRLGYYYDDWYTLWSGVSRGASSLVTLFSTDRPFMGLIYSLIFRAIGDSILGWHIAALVFRIAGAIAFYWILNLVWPKMKSLSVLAAMVFVAFPGFLAEPNATTKINQLMGFAGALFSIAFILRAIKTSRRVWRYVFIALSLLTMAFYLWIYEYMLGLEVMRLALLSWVLWQQGHEKVLGVAKRVILTYLPFILVMAVFLYWRAFVFQGSRTATDLQGLVSAYQMDFKGMLIRLAFQLPKDFLSASLFAWFVQPYRLLTSAPHFSWIGVAVLTGLAAVILAIVYIFVTGKWKKFDPESDSPWAVLLVGALITLGAIFPVVLSSRFINLDDAYKAYALHPSAGVLIMLIGLLLMMKPRFRKVGLIALLGFSVMAQMLNGQEWAGYWQTQQNFFWQLTWRAPDIRDNTLVMAYIPEGYAFHEDYEIWGPINLIYRSEPMSAPQIEAQILNQETLAYVLDGSLRDNKVRDISVPKDYSNLLLIGQPTAESCLHAIDGTMPVYSDNERPLVSQVGGRSDIALIDPTATTPIPPAIIFGQEPEHGWCYYYEQASLARQTGDWQKIGDLYDAAVAAGLEPGDTSEYFVFIEGLVNAGRVDAASEIAGDYVRDDLILKDSLCTSLSSAPDYPDSYGYNRDQIYQIVCQ